MDLEGLSLVLKLIAAVAVAIIVALLVVRLATPWRSTHLPRALPELNYPIRPLPVYIVDNQPANAEVMRQYFNEADVVVGHHQLHVDPDRVHVFPAAKRLARWVRWQQIAAFVLEFAWDTPMRDERSIILCDIEAETNTPGSLRSNLRSVRALRTLLGQDAIIIVHTHRVAPAWLQATHDAGANACLAKQLSTRDDLITTIQWLAGSRPKSWITLTPFKNTRLLTISSGPGRARRILDSTEG